MRPPGRSAAASNAADSNPLHDATWLYSYADLMTQLLIFAILMLTVLGLEKPKPAARPAAEDQLADTMRQVEQFARESGLGDALVLARAADRLVIRMPSAILFEDGQATLTPAAARVLAGLTPVLAGGSSRLRVEGHTDDVPVRGAFASNWELSTARAITVVEHLAAHGVAPARLSVAGYAEFHPLVPNDAPEHRAQNRRVEIVVLGG